MVAFQPLAQQTTFVSLLIDESLTWLHFLLAGPDQESAEL